MAQRCRQGADGRLERAGRTFAAYDNWPDMPGRAAGGLVFANPAAKAEHVRTIEG